MAAVPPAQEYGASAGSLLEEVSVDLLTKVLEFSLLHERLNLAMCNKQLLAGVTQECSSLWVHIDLLPFKERHKDIENFLDKHYAKLTDEMLASLLTNVNAREVTKSLRLWGCTKVKGTGLEPLRHSRILERVDLKMDRVRDGMDEAFVMDVLSTMIPHKLFQVRFPQWYNIRVMGRSFDSYGGELADRRASFSCDLRVAKRQQALEEGTTCSSCRHPVCDASRQIVARRTGPPPLHCSECLQYYCHTGVCPVGMKNCGMCGTASCTLCNGVRQCTICKNAYCNGCEYVSPYPCTVCHGTYCQDCDEFVTECSIPGCRKCICSTCAENAETNHPVPLFCEACMDLFCVECGQFSACEECGDEVCFKCAQTDTCDECNETKLSYCEGCFERGICKCEICEKSVCQSCSTQEDELIRNCDACCSAFCQDCRTVGPCSCGTDCDYHFCSDCDADECNHLCSNRSSKRLKRSDSSDSDSEDSV